MLAPAFLGASFLGTGPAMADAPSPLLLSQTCAGCHGPDGRSPGAIPSLYGRSAQSIAETLRAFRSGALPGTVMTRLAKGYAEDEIDAVAGAIAAQWK